jgi:FAD synthase
MTYIGRRPSMENHEMRNETNIIEFGGDYSRIKTGENQTVLFIKKIRDEKKFHNLDDLQKSIYNDKSVVKELYSVYRSKGNPDTGIFL